MPGTSFSVAAIQVAPGVPDRAAAKRWVTAPIASAATAVKSASWERGWSRSTSCNARMSGSRMRIASVSRRRSTTPSRNDRPCRMLNVANRMERRYRSSLPSPTAEPEEESELRTALKRSAAALKAAEVPFALGGGYALWVHGAPEPEHDVDLVVAEHDVPAAVDTLAAAGFEIERPPEDWLFKSWLGESLVDVLHRLRGIPVTDELIQTAVEVEVLGIRIPVLPATPIMEAKLHALSEHYADFAAMLPAVPGGPRTAGLG